MLPTGSADAPAIRKKHQNAGKAREQWQCFFNSGSHQWTTHWIWSQQRYIKQPRCASLPCSTIMASHTCPDALPCSAMLGLCFIFWALRDLRQKQSIILLLSRNHSSYSLPKETTFPLSTFAGHSSRKKISQRAAERMEKSCPQPPSPEQPQQWACKQAAPQLDEF